MRIPSSYTSLQVPLQVSHLLRCSFHAEISSEQSIKDLQAQNTQFQQMFISLAKGQEDLKALILKEKKKKKKVAGILNMGRRFGELLKRQVDLTSSSKEGENQEE